MSAYRGIEFTFIAVGFYFWRPAPGGRAKSLMGSIYLKESYLIPLPIIPVYSR